MLPEQLLITSKLLLMGYAVALTSRNDVSIQWTILKIFGDDTWDHLLSAGLKVTSNRWAQWQSKRGDLVVIPDLPNLSLFAHIDEGPISFTNFASLRAECATVLSRVKDVGVRELLEVISTATTVAEAQNQVIKISPAASGENEGDHFSVPT